MLEERKYCGRCSVEKYTERCLFEKGYRVRSVGDPRPCPALRRMTNEVRMRVLQRAREEAVERYRVQGAFGYD